MKQKELLTNDQAPWIEYLIINKNGKRVLKVSTPLKIRKAYKEHLKQIKRSTNNNTPISK